MQTETRLHFELQWPVEIEGDIFVAVKKDHREGKELVPPLTMKQEKQGKWTASVSFKLPKLKTISYYYFVRQPDGRCTFEEGERQLCLSAFRQDSIHCLDTWKDSASPAAAFLKAPFQKVFFRQKKNKLFSPVPGATHLFRVGAVPLESDEVVCILGNFSPEEAWDTGNPVLMDLVNGQWTVGLKLTSGKTYAYKYGVFNQEQKKFRYYEEGPNRSLPVREGEGEYTIVSDHFFRFREWPWKGAGVSVPVFSLRSKNSTGIGEFTDLKNLIDWAQRTGFRLIQLLPVNDTTATRTWHDSYPYAAISAFALNPVYIHLEKAGKLPESHETWKKYKKEKESMALLPEIDYEKTLRLKWQYLRALFALKREEFLKDRRFKTFFRQHRHWLVPYAAFCFLRDKYGTADYAGFGAWAVYEVSSIDRLTDPASPDYEEIAIHYFVQFHLHRQLEAMSGHARKKGIALKGDIPIGIYRHSVEAWMYPDEFNLGNRAGAPPDGFAVRGQNWGFPTYHWARMEANHFRWWQNRLKHLALYFDAIRYDHILGFFRIWQIPEDQIEGVMGYFQPDLPLSLAEMETMGIHFDEERFCRPFINEQVLQDFFGKDAALIRDTFLDKKGNDRYDLKAHFSVQKEIDQYFRRLEKEGKPLPGHLCLGLFDLVSNILFFPTEKQGYFRPRIALMNTSSYQWLPAEVQQRLRQVHDIYFYRRHESFWQKEALRKLPALKRATDMLVCGEDLGMVPESVPQVMHALGLLSLEVQRMPKQWGEEFARLKEAPYLSVVTPGTHDMSTIRGWWEEDRGKSQRFYNEVLEHHGAAPYFCEPWVVREIIEQHFQSPAMWALIQLQDLLGMSAQWRRENPHEERINIPANPRHYWRYRMHLDLEQLLDDDKFSETVREMISRAGR